jgi:hypothetical protein
MHFPFFRWPEGSKQVFFCEGATKGNVQNITTLIFMGGGPTSGATSRILGIISAFCHIMNYFCPKPNFALGLQEMHTRKIGEKYREVPWGCGTLEPRPNMVPTPTGRHRWHREFDLDLEGGPREFRKNQKKWKNNARSHSE